MSTFHEHGGRYIHYAKGAPDVLLDRCDRILINNDILPLSDELRKQIEEANHLMASEALRVLAAAMNLTEALPGSPEEAEKGLVFLGLAGMIDPARSEVRDAVSVCLRAGMRPIMITGDHKTTAVAIARQLGILSEGQEAVTGAELDKIPDDEFQRTVEKYSVYARVAPEHKVRIVEAWQKRGKICSMTGDGVNDAPALKKADIGVGMGITGTDVTKNVADMVLTDDNFATIVVAVEEGRKIYSNIRKCIQYLLSANLSEVLSVLAATLMGYHLLHTIHILWINLISDTFPALALGIEKSEKDIMDRPPRGAGEGIFSSGLGISVAYQGIILSLLTVAAFFIGLAASPETATTMAFCTLTFSQMFHSLNVRSPGKSLFKIGFFSNRLAIGALALSIGLTFGIVQIPGVNDVFRLTSLNGLQWFQVFLLSAAIVPVVELVKYIQGRKNRV
jgi:Ca2+-transporting ATPase